MAAQWPVHELFVGEDLQPDKKLGWLAGDAGNDRIITGRAAERYVNLLCLKPYRLIRRLYGVRRSIKAPHDEGCAAGRFRYVRWRIGVENNIRTRGDCALWREAPKINFIGQTSPLEVVADSTPSDDIGER